MASWIDVVIVLGVALGVIIGAYHGVLRQLMLIAAFYCSLVVALRYYGSAAAVLMTYLSEADRDLAGAYTLAGITTAGTLGLTWMSGRVYRTTGLGGLVMFDRLAGAGLGAAWSWAVIAFAVSVVLYGLTLSWGPQEALRLEIDRAIDRSMLFGAARGTLPILRELLRPWLPGGLPAPLIG